MLLAHVSMATAYTLQCISTRAASLSQRSFHDMSSNMKSDWIHVLDRWHDKMSNLIMSACEGTFLISLPLRFHRWNNQMKKGETDSMKKFNRSLDGTETLYTHGLDKGRSACQQTLRQHFIMLDITCHHSDIVYLSVSSYEIQIKYIVSQY